MDRASELRFVLSSTSPQLAHNLYYVKLYWAENLPYRMTAANCTGFAYLWPAPSAKLFGSPVFPTGSATVPGAIPSGSLCAGPIEGLYRNTLRVVQAQ